MVGDHEAAGAIPVIPTNSVVQHQDNESCVGRHLARSGPSLDAYRYLVDAGETPAACSQRHRSAERDTILRRSSAEVQLLSVAPRFCVAPSGTVPDSNPGRAAFDSLAAC